MSKRCRSSTVNTGRSSNSRIRSPCRRPSRPAAAGDLHDQHGGVGGALQPARQAGIERRGLAGQAEASALHPSVTHQPRGDVDGRVDTDGEAEALSASDHGGVDANHPAGAVDKWAAGVAGIERSIGLDHALDQPAVRRPQRPPERADDAGRDGGLKAERIADGHDKLTHPQPVGRTEGRVRKARAGQAQHSQIGGGIVADHGGGEPSSVGEAGRNLLRAGNDVADWSAGSRPA